MDLKDILDAEGGLDKFLTKNLVGEVYIEGDDFAHQWPLKLTLYEEKAGKPNKIYSGIWLNCINDKTRKPPFQYSEELPDFDKDYYYLHSYIHCLHAFNDQVLYDAGNYGIYNSLTDEKIYRGDVRALMSRGDELYCLTWKYEEGNKIVGEILPFDHFKRVDIHSRKLIDVPELKRMTEEQQFVFHASLRRGASSGYHFCGDERRAVFRGDLLRAVLEKALEVGEKWKV